MSVVQGGIGFPVLHPCVYNYIWSGIYVGTHILDDNIMQSSIRELVGMVSLNNYERFIIIMLVSNKLRKCESDAAVREVFSIPENCDILFETG